MDEPDRLLATWIPPIGWLVNWIPTIGWLVNWIPPIGLLVNWIPLIGWLVNWIPPMQMSAVDFNGKPPLHTFGLVGKNVVSDLMINGWI